MDALQNETQWTNLQAFKAVADHGSIGQAALALGITHATLRKRVDDLEAWLNYPLLTRSKKGTELTTAGEEIHRLVGGIGKIVKAIKLTPNPTNDDPSGTVKLHIENCLAPHLFAPRLKGFFDEYPDIKILLTSSEQSGDPGTSDIDVSITTDQPTSLEAVARKVGVINYACFASEKYIEEHGVPSSLRELLNHRTLNLVQYMPYLENLEPEVAKAMSLASHSLITDDMVSLVETISSGGGIGLLPSYYETAYPNLHAMELLPVIRVDLLMVYHNKSRERASVRALTEWIKDMFEMDESGQFDPIWRPAAEFRPAAE